MSRLTPPVGPDDHAQGPADAPVTLVEYGDYECPYCGEAYPVLKAVQQAMGDQLRFVFRNFPLTQQHPHAGRAAEFAEAAASIGRFWEAHDLLYEHQDALDDASLVAYAQLIGLDHAHLRAGFEGRYDEKIRHDFSGGLRSGVNGTPTLFVNGLRYDGPRDVESLVETLRAAAAEPA
ncbi:DsbA family protein [Ancylobacter sonchi]|uniref:DsbA family protein n=1 Tax=Ancylobacter sonchi TaxID=1937790 RepID=UPI001BD42275|nr:DsbA family protein [Ancylobacter sonchi]MBS7532860.1 DsbA family protein [Ancylobacter sonchi]